MFESATSSSLAKWASSYTYIPHKGSFTFSAERSGCYRSKIYRIQGQVFADTTLSDTFSLNGGTVQIGSLSFGAAAVTNSYAKIIPTVDIPNAQANFGINTTFQMAGNTLTGVLPCSLNMYVPEEIEITNRNCCEYGISKSSDLIITWNADASNNEGVYIVFAYDGPLSNQLNSSLSAISLKVSQWVNDNGSYTIPNGAFSSFPVGGQVTILIMRGNIGYGITSIGEKYKFEAYTSATHHDHLIN
ncbi:MAG TPA: hypothetical protein DIW47_06080 [Bacteroidetes bacterium]|nr:hypothetical protein [Bacteroidota bacterium]